MVCVDAHAEPELEPVIDMDLTIITQDTVAGVAPASECFPTIII